MNVATHLALFLFLFASTNFGQETKACPGEFDDLASWLPGSYDTFAQANEDCARQTGYQHVRAVLRIVRLHGSLPGFFKDKPVFYLEQALEEQIAQPYRQRVLVLERRACAEAVLVDYRLVQPKEWSSASAARLSQIRPEELVREGGCEVTWTRAGKELFVGAAGSGGSCRTTLRGATHVISYSGLTAGSLVSLDQGFDDAGAHRWGPPPGVVGHVFRKRTEPSR